MGSDKDLLHILDGLVLGDALAYRRPIRSLFAQHVILRVDENNSGR